MNTLINFPQGPISDDNNNVTLEWRQWFQNQQVLSLLIAGGVVIGGDVTVDGDINVAQIFNLQTQLAMIPNFGPTIAKVALSLDATNVAFATAPKFNSEPLSRRIDNLAIMGAFV